MVLLTQMFRTAAITGRTDVYDASWFAGRQGGRWANQTVSNALPNLPPNTPRTPPAVAAQAQADPAETLRELIELHKRGIVTDAEFEHLRAGLSDG